MRDISPLLAPRSLAIIGASANPRKPGGALLRNIVDGGYGGELYAVNPNTPEVLGQSTFASIGDVPRPVDVAFIATPRSSVASVVEDCAKQGVRSICIITAGFAEVGGTGLDEQNELVRLARAGSMMAIGPNTIGLINSNIDLMASYARFSSWQDGYISICAQSGIFAGAAVSPVMSQRFQRIGIGKSIDIGNRCDVGEEEFLSFAADDPGTRVVGIYAESLPEPRAFLEAARVVTAEKPVIILKPGRTEAGARASVSHTGAIATDDRILDSGLRQYGLTRAENVEEFLDLLKLFSYIQSQTVGDRVAVLTYSGAMGVIAIDQVANSGLRLAELNTSTLSRIAKVMPEWQPANHPVDAMLSVEASGFRHGTEEPIDALLEDDGVDMVLCVLYSPTTAGAFPDLRDSFAGLQAKHPDKPLVLVVFGTTYEDEWVGELDGLSIPVFPSTGAAIRAMSALAEYSRYRSAI